MIGNVFCRSSSATAAAIVFWRSRGGPCASVAKPAASSPPAERQVDELLGIGRRVARRRGWPGWSHASAGRGGRSASAPGRRRCRASGCCPSRSRSAGRRAAGRPSRRDRPSHRSRRGRRACAGGRRCRRPAISSSAGPRRAADAGGSPPRPGGSGSRSRRRASRAATAVFGVGRDRDEASSRAG